MTLPIAATKIHFDQQSDDPRQARAEFARLVDKFNALLAHLGSSIVTSVPGGEGEGLETSGGTLRIKLNGSTVDRSTSGLALNTGIGANQIVRLDGTGKIPAVNGSLVTSVQGVPTGGIIFWGSSSPPSGYLVCDGSAIDRTTYATLFGVLGTSFGVGDGSTTFNIPDMRGRSPIGIGQGATLSLRTMGQILGEEIHILTEVELPSHTHSVGTLEANSTGSDHYHTMYGGNLTSNDSTDIIGTGSGNTGNNKTTITDHPNGDGSHTHALSGSFGSTGSSTGHQNMQPSLVVNFIVKT